MVVHLFLHLCQHGCIYGWCVVVLCISLPANTVIFHIIGHLFFENGLFSSPPPIRVAIFFCWIPCLSCIRISCWMNNLLMFFILRWMSLHSCILLFRNQLVWLKPQMPVFTFIACALGKLSKSHCLLNVLQVILESPDSFMVWGSHV